MKAGLVFVKYLINAHNVIIHKQKGFTLVGMVVGMGLLSALTVGFMEFMRGSIAGQQKIMQVREVGELKTEMGILLDNESHCRNSIAGPGKFREVDPEEAFTFQKTKMDTEEEGREVELFASKQNEEERAERLFYAKKKYGTLTIESIKLFMGEDTTNGGEYAPSDGHEDIGTLKVVVENLDKNKQHFYIKLSVFMQTDEQGNSTLLSCSRESSARRCGDKEKWTPNCGCVAKGEVHIRAMRGETEESFTCQSLTCKPQEKWHAQCGCISLADYERIEQNPEQENPCQQKTITFFDDVGGNDHDSETTLGKFDFCFLNKVRFSIPCNNASERHCEVDKDAEGNWVAKDYGNMGAGCGGGSCSVVCLGGSGDGCEPPKKMVNGECTSCDSPNQWYGLACENCEGLGYSYRCNRCKQDCPPRPHSPCAISSQWSDHTCGCIPVTCGAESGGQ